MGDPSTHVILYQGYWYLVYQDDDVPTEWRTTSDFNIVCNVGEEEQKIELKRIQS